MTKFAEYGFNKSHTAAYAVVTYHTAWLKRYHCAAFMAATMSSDMDNTDSVKIFYEDTIANKVKVLGPDVNASNYRFEPVDRETIRYGLGAVKGTGEQAVNVILKAREAGGPFKDLFDFCQRCDKRMVNRRTIEALIKAGAFDSIAPATGQDRPTAASCWPRSAWPWTSPSRPSATPCRPACSTSPMLPTSMRRNTSRSVRGTRRPS
jgi:DNA polymerase-3 subunit alpha